MTQAEKDLEDAKDPFAGADGQGGIDASQNGANSSNIPLNGSQA